MESNPLSRALSHKHITLPKILSDLTHASFVLLDKQVTSDKIEKLFPLTSNKKALKLKKSKVKKNTPKKVGVVFSGGQAPGGHNVIWGLEEALRKIHKDSVLYGFIGGPIGFLENKHIKLTEDLIAPYHNLGGFNLIGSGRDKIETPEDLNKALDTANKLDLDGFVIIGGDDSNTNAAYLAEHFKSKNCKTIVIGVPKTIDGDLQNDYVDISFGFDTACRLYSELVGNILTDVESSMKYYHFIKLMGRAASHVTLEVGLQTQPNLVLIGEEIKEKKLSLDNIIESICNLIIKRTSLLKNYGVILIPEGLIDFIPEFSLLIEELNFHLAEDPSLNNTSILEKLKPEVQSFFKKLPESIQVQLLLDRDPHGNIQLAKIDTEDLLIEMTKNKLNEKKYKGQFRPISHYFGYEGRSANPSPFDAEYTFALGQCSALLINEKHSGYMACIKNLKKSSQDWEVYAIPITSLLNIEERHGKQKPVIKKALVDLNGNLFKYFDQLRDSWQFEDHYNAPGPIQYFGSEAICKTKNFTIQL